MNRLVLPFTLLAVLSLVFQTQAIAQRCTGMSDQCTFVLPNGHCCHRVTSLPGLAPKEEGVRPLWVKFNEDDCGIVKDTAYFIPCFGVEGSTCGTKKATPTCT